MDEMNYEAIFYDLPDGTEPALDFIKSLDVKMRAKLEKSIALLQQVGPELRLPYSEHLDDGIFEVRAKQGTNITRVLYFFFVGKKIILTNGFVKKTQKTPLPGIIIPGSDVGYFCFTSVITAVLSAKWNTVT